MMGLGLRVDGFRIKSATKAMLVNGVILPIDLHKYLGEETT